MSYLQCPQCGTMVQQSTGGAVCMNSFCGWREIPYSRITRTSAGTLTKEDQHPLTTGVTSETRLKHLAHMLLDDLIQHHHKIVHTMNVPNDCVTCALIQDAQSILK